MTIEQIERQRRIDEMNAATDELNKIYRISGKRAAALAAPVIFARLGIEIDLTVSDI